MKRLLPFLLPLLLSAAAHAQPGSNPPPVPMKHTQFRTMTSRYVKEEFQLLISLPANYHPDSARRYAVIYLTDADYSFGMTKDLANYLNWGEEIPEHIIVGVAYGGNVANWGQKRQRDFLPVANKDVYLSGGAAQFTDFLEKELIPFVDSAYRTKPQDRTLIGMSYGGVFGTYVLLKRPGIFKRYILGTTYFGYEKGELYTYEKEYAATHADLPARVYASVGGAETYALEHFGNFTKVLADRKYPNLKLKAEVLPDEVHSSVGGGTLARGLRWVFDGYFYDERKVASLTPEQYDRYTGLYELAENKFKVNILRQDNGLVLKTEDGTQVIELLPESESDFFAKKEKLELAFFQEKKKVAGFVIRGKEGRFKRVAPTAAGK
jgi:hypothetical protein